MAMVLTGSGPASTEGYTNQGFKGYGFQTQGVTTTAPTLPAAGLGFGDGVRSKGREKEKEKEVAAATIREGQISGFEILDRAQLAQESGPLTWSLGGCSSPP